jgi:hypothetical protein
MKRDMPVADPARVTTEPALDSRSDTSPAHPPASPEARPGSAARFLVALVVGLAGAAFIWVVAPFNNVLLGLGWVSDSYLPIAALFVMLVLVLGVCPLLRWIRPGLALSQSQLAVIFGILLVASVLPGQGLLHQFPYALAGVPVETSQNRSLAGAYQAQHIPPSLFPDSIEFGAETPQVSYFTRGAGGQPIPWGAWVGPLLAWAPFLVGLWLMTIGLALAVLPQWRRNERLAFPLLTLQEALIEPPGEGRLWAPLFRSRLFWIAAGAVFGLHLLSGLHAADPEAVPAIPLHWSLGGLYTEGILRRVPPWIARGQIYFILVGTAYFMSSRVGFSIWFFVIAYAIYGIIGGEYVPGFAGLAGVRDHRIGAMFVMTGVILWLGRAHWRRILQCMFRPPRSHADGREALAGWMVLLGSAGVFAWMVALMGVQWWWASWYTAYILMVSLLICRLVAETGMPFLRIDDGGSVPFVRLIGANLARAGGLRWLSGASLYMQSLISMLVTFASRVHASVMGCHGLALEEASGERRQGRLALVFVAVLAIGLVACGAVHLDIAYRNSQTLQGTGQPINSGATGSLSAAGWDLIRLGIGQVNVSDVNSPDRADRGVGHLLLGMALAGALSWLCLRSPRWPLHPVGLLIVSTHYGNWGWPSIFLGWGAKSLILRYGGARAYRQARPAFLGLIVGEVFASAFWCIEPALRFYVFGTSYTPVIIQST